MAKRNLTDLGCKQTVYITPEKLLDPVRTYFGGQIPFDPATEPSNPTKALAFATKEPPLDSDDPVVSEAMRNDLFPDWLHNGLEQVWRSHDGVFVNPPYGRDLKLWCEKISAEAISGTPIIALLPAGARFGTRYFQRFIFVPQLNVSCFVKGRVKFLRPDGSPTTGQNPYDSVFYGFNVDEQRFAKLFGHLGSVLKMELLL